jgi:hypothetical protein
MKTIFKLSEKAGLAPTVIGAIAWLACGTGATIAIPDALWQYRRLAIALTILVIIATGIGGLIGYWLVADRIDFWRLGCQVKWLNANDWVYEERSATSEERILPYLREVHGHGYPAPCTIRILSHAEWESEAPLWARGRRTEIVERIANCHGAMNGGDVQIMN